MFDVHPDCRFLMIKRPTATDGESASPIPRKIIIVTNWDEELKKLAPMD